MSREPVTKTKRGYMGKGRKHRLWEAANGVCAWCLKAVDKYGAAVRYDHFIPLALGGPDTDDNIRPLHTRPCDAIKTAFDVKRIAKAKRLEKAERGERKPSCMRSAPFKKRLKPYQWPKTPLRSRPFAKTRQEIEG